MKTKLFNILVIFLLIFTLYSCGKTQVDPDSSDIIIDDEKDPNTDKPVVTPPSNEGTEFVVSLVYNKRIYEPKENEIITVWITYSI